MELKQILVTGKVQGVGFRRFVQKRARQNSVLGWTRNLSDGRVEILATGSDKDMESFLNWVRRGPPGSVVDEVSIKATETVDSFDDFSVHGDGEKPHA